MGAKIRGCEPPNRIKRSEIVRVKTVEKQRFIILSTQCFGTMTHWYCGRSHECTKEKGTCKGCVNSWPDKFLAYIHVLRMSPQEECYVELTETAYKMLLTATLGVELRGATVDISKTKGGAKGKYIIARVEHAASVRHLPEEKDPYPLLSWLWNYKNPAGQPVDLPV